MNSPLWVKRNRVRIAAYGRKYYAQDPEKFRRKQRERYIRNGGKMQKRKWRKANPEKYVLGMKRRIPVEALQRQIATCRRQLLHARDEIRRRLMKRVVRLQEEVALLSRFNGDRKEYAKRLRVERLEREEMERRKEQDIKEFELLRARMKEMEAKVAAQRLQAILRDEIPDSAGLTQAGLKRKRARRAGLALAAKRESGLQKRERGWKGEGEVLSGLADDCDLSDLVRN